MRLKDAEENEMRQKMLQSLKLTPKNMEIAEKYLDMDFSEDPQLLAQVEPQEYQCPYYVYSGRKHYYLDDWLKHRGKEELGRYVRFLVETGGSTAWQALLNSAGCGGLEELEKFLAYHTGEHARAQSMAVRAGLCANRIGRNQDTTILCLSGKEEPDIFRQAIKYCRKSDGNSSSDQRSNAGLLLAAMYLHYMEPETAPEITEYLEDGLLRSLGDIAQKSQEIQVILEYVKSAGKDTPFPQRILSIFGGRKGESNTAFIAGCAFLAVRHSLRFEILLRLAVAVHYRYRGRNIALDTCLGIVQEDWFHARMEELDEMLPMEDDNYIYWCLNTGCREEVARMAVKCPTIIKAVADMVESEKYRTLMEIIQKANPALYGEMEPLFHDTLCRKLAAELVKPYYAGKLEAKKYLCGECSVESLAQFLEKWEENFYSRMECYEKINFLKEIGEVSMYRRAMILEALKHASGYFQQYSIKLEGDTFGQAGEASAVNTKRDYLMEKEQIKRMIALLEQEELPLGMQIYVLGGIGEAIDDKKKENHVFQTCVELFAEELEKRQDRSWADEMKEALLAKNGKNGLFCLNVLKKLDVEQYSDVVLSCAADDSKAVRRLLTELSVEHREWEPQILLLLTSKQVKAREFAILVLEEWADPSCLEAVRTALDKEKNKKLIQLLTDLTQDLEAAAKEGAVNHGRSPEERLAARIFRGARKRKVEWVQAFHLPQVHRQDGGVVSQEYMLSVLAAYADMEMAGVNQDAAKLAVPLVQEELAIYMQALYEEWLEAGAEAKNRWVLYAASIHGGTAMVDALYAQIKVWAEHSRGAMAAEAVKALAFHGSSEAMTLVDQMSRKFKNRQVRNAAGKALLDAAEALGISREELEDQLVPDMGFDEHMERIFDYGSRKFKVNLNFTLELEVYDSNGKRLKTLPSPGKQDDAQLAKAASDEYKQLKKQLKSVVQNQKLRLEQALSTARYWKIELWRKLFVKNPIMHQFAMGCVWGVYEGDTLIESFRYMEDGTFNTVDEKEYVLPEPDEKHSEPSAECEGSAFGACQVGLVHPLELSKETLSAWQNQLSDYEVIQPFEQLNRPVYLVPEEEEESKAFLRFDGKTVHSLTLSGKLLEMGWYRGEILDAGFYTNYYRNDGNVGAELTFSGTSVGYENEEVTVYQLYFYQKEDSSELHSEETLFNEHNKCELKKVNPRYFSEVVLQVARAVEKECN